MVFVKKAVFRDYFSRSDFSNGGFLRFTSYFSILQLFFVKPRNAFDSLKFRLDMALTSLSRLVLNWSFQLGSIRNNFLVLDSGLRSLLLVLHLC